MLIDARRKFLLLFAAIAACAFGCSRGPTYEQAVTVAASGDHERAIELFSELAETMEEPEIYVSRANCYSHLNNLQEALADYQKAIELMRARSPREDDPVLPLLYYNRGLAYERMQQFAHASADYEKALELRTDYPGVSNNLAWILSTCPDESVRNPERAVELAEQAIQLAPEDAKVLDTVAACYASAGDFDRATAAQEKAISACTDAAAIQRYEGRLELYRAGTPYVDKR